MFKQTAKLLFFAAFFLLFVNVVSAQEAGDLNAKKFGVTFPVAELGNCANFSSCRAYCDDQTHLNQCIAFAKKKGFYKEEKPPENKKEDMSKILEKAKEILGCESEQACRNICEQQSNREKCSKFAQETGLGGGEKRVGPGGCTSEESCRAYCDAHEEECRKFGGGPGDGKKDEDRGKDRGEKPPQVACKTKEECEAFCKNPANAEACKNVVVGGDDKKGPSLEEVGAQMGKIRQNFEQMPEESRACIQKAIGSETYAKIMSGQPLTTPIDSGAMQACFAQGVKEYEEKNQPTKKPDDYSTDFGPSGEQVRPSETEQITTIQQQITPAQTSQVKGASANRSLLNVIFDWLRGK